MIRKAVLALLATAAMTGLAAADTAAPDPDALLRAAFDNWRADSSQTDMTMTVHRPDWERSMEMKTWTQGDDDALVRFTAPAKDAGNATLKKGDETWVFNPKLNQVIKLPASMLAQSWMGSDFSYNDLSKANDLLTKYTHKLTGSTKSGPHTVYSIDAIPKPGAPIVWGKRTVRVRDDGIMLSETYYDQDMKPVREMTTEKVSMVGGRDYPVVMTMRPKNEDGKWTRIETKAATFDQSMPGYLFTLSNLQNPRN